MRPRVDPAVAVLVRVVSSAAGDCTASVLEPADLRALSVELVRTTPELASRALADAGLGNLRDGYAWLDVDALRTAASSASAPDRDFDAMVSYAASQGWLSDDGRQLRAHCDHTDPPPG